MHQDASLTMRECWLSLFAVCISYFAIVVDASVLNFAVSTIRAHLSCSIASAQWAGWNSLAVLSLLAASVAFCALFVVTRRGGAVR